MNCCVAFSEPVTVLVHLYWRLAACVLEPFEWWCLVTVNKSLSFIERLSQKCQPLRVPEVNRGASQELCQHAKGVGGLVVPPFFLWEGVWDALLQTVERPWCPLPLCFPCEWERLSLNCLASMPMEPMLFLSVRNWTSLISKSGML